MTDEELYFSGSRGMMNVLEEVDVRVRASIGLGEDPEVEQAVQPVVESAADEPLREAAVSGGG